MYPKGSVTQQKPGEKRLVRRRVLPEYLEYGEIQTLLKSAPSEQARLLILLQWRAGLRVSEALALQMGDLSLEGDRPTLRVRRGKGNKQRVVPVHPELRAALNTLIGYVGGKKAGCLLPNHRTTAWTWVRKSMARAVENGLLAPGRQVGTHTLRHSAARHWLASGVPLNVVSRWLGHSSLQTTLIYLEILPDPLGNMERVP